MTQLPYTFSGSIYCKRYSLQRVRSPIGKYASTGTRPTRRKISVDHSIRPMARHHRDTLRRRNKSDNRVRRRNYSNFRRSPNIEKCDKCVLSNRSTIECRRSDCKDGRRRRLDRMCMLIKVLHCAIQYNTVLYSSKITVQ